MHSDVKKRWVEALRSGEYRQGKHRLRYVFKNGATEHCCLGVLCDISGLGKWVGSNYVVGDMDSSLVLPAPVAEWAGLMGAEGEDEPREVGPSLRPGGKKYAAMNDEGRTFKQIAAMIERYA